MSVVVPLGLISENLKLLSSAVFSSIPGGIPWRITTVYGAWGILDFLSPPSEGSWGQVTQFSRQNGFTALCSSRIQSFTWRFLLSSLQDSQVHVVTLNPTDTLVLCLLKNGTSALYLRSGDSAVLTAVSVPATWVPHPSWDSSVCAYQWQTGWVFSQQDPRQWPPVI